MPQRRKTVERLKLEGTFRRDRHAGRENALTLALSTPEAPAWLDDAAKAEWNRILSDDRYAQAITEADRALLALYCVLWAEIEGAGAKGAVSSIQTSRLTLFTAICGRLGFDPTARTKIQVSARKPTNEFAELAEESRRISDVN